MDTLATRAEYLRRTAGLGVREADRLAGTHRGQCAQIERGHRENPRRDALVKIAALYGARLDWLLTGEGKAPSERSIKRAVAAAVAASGGEVRS
jgi:transcriptional regulator with XRE-family HTH domain